MISRARRDIDTPTAWGRTRIRPTKEMKQVTLRVIEAPEFVAPPQVKPMPPSSVTPDGSGLIQIMRPPIQVVSETPLVTTTKPVQQIVRRPAATTVIRAPAQLPTLSTRQAVIQIPIQAVFPKVKQASEISPVVKTRPDLMVRPSLDIAEIQDTTQTRRIISIPFLSTRQIQQTRVEPATKQKPKTYTRLISVPALQALPKTIRKFKLPDTKEEKKPKKATRRKKREKGFFEFMPIGMLR